MTGAVPDGTPLDGSSPDPARTPYGAGAPSSARRLSPLTPVVRAPLLLLAVLGASWQPVAGQGAGTASLTVLGLLVFGALAGIASWLRTTYVVTAEEVRIDTGVVTRRSRRIRIDRLQGIDVLQPLVARLMGVAELRFDVAGGDREGSLAFLPLAEAEELRALLLGRRDALRSGEGPVAVPSDGGGVRDASATEPSRRPLLQVPFGRLAAAQALSLETLVAGAWVVGMVVTFGATGAVVAGGGAVPVALALVLGAGRRVTGFYGFTLSETAEGLHVRRGLGSLTSQSIDPERVQGVVLVEPLLWRLLGWARLDVSVAGYGQAETQQRESATTLVPVGPVGEVRAVAVRVLQGRDPGRVVLRPAPRRARLRSPLSAWTLALGQDDELVVSRRGWWARRLDVVPQGRVQSLRVTQGPAQRLLRLAAVHVDSPPGPVVVRGEQCASGDARAFADLATTLSRRARRRDGAAQPSVRDTTQ